MECPQCHGPFKDPTTFPCGHSCCMEEAKNLSSCCTCSSALNPEDMITNYSMRDIVVKLSAKLSGESDEDLLPLLECPICFIPFIDPTTFPCGHSVCLEEAKELRSCPICSNTLPKSFVVNVSMKSMISNLIKSDSAIPSSTQSADVKKSEDNQDNSDIDEEDKHQKQNNSISTTTNKKKKKKNKKSKKQITNDQIAELYSKAQYSEDKEARERLMMLSESNQIALGYCSILQDISGSLQPFDKQQIAKQLIPFLEGGVSNNDKYCLFISGFLHCAVKQTIRGLQLLKRSANLGYVAAEHWLGMILTVLNNPAAIEWFKKAAMQGNAMSQYQVGELIEKHSKDSREAFRYYKMAADNGHMEAQGIVGDCYYGKSKLKGCVTDKKEAMRYFRMAADQGLNIAAYNVATHNFEGIGIPVNISLGKKYMHIAATKGLDIAQFFIGFNHCIGKYEYETNYQKAEPFLKMAADQGHLQSQKILGLMYLNGEGGMSKNKTEAFWYFKLAANQGDDIAQYELGKMYEDGEVVPIDQEEANRLLTLAADQGVSEACRIIGRRYLEGSMMVEMDKAKGIKYLKVACDQRNEEAYHVLGVAYFIGDGVEVNHNLAFMYIKSSADCGFDDAFISVAKLYLNGFGTTKNITEGVKYLRMAASKGDAEAQALLFEYS